MNRAWTLKAEPSAELRGVDCSLKRTSAPPTSNSTAGGEKQLVAGTTRETGPEATLPTRARPRLEPRSAGPEVGATAEQTSATMHGQCRRKLGSRSHHANSTSKNQPDCKPGSRAGAATSTLQGGAADERNENLGSRTSKKASRSLG